MVRENSIARTVIVTCLTPVRDFLTVLTAHRPGTCCQCTEHSLCSRVLQGIRFLASRRSGPDMGEARAKVSITPLLLILTRSSAPLAVNQHLTSTAKVRLYNVAWQMRSGTRIPSDLGGLQYHSPSGQSGWVFLLVGDLNRQL